MNERPSRRPLRWLTLAAVLAALCVGGALTGGGDGPLGGYAGNLWSYLNGGEGGGASGETADHAENEGGSGKDSTGPNGANAGGGNSGSSPGTAVTADGLDPGALPVGIEKPDGAGGTGVERAVRKNGVWFPVYSPGTGSGSWPPPLNVVPLTVSSPPAPAGKAGEAYHYQAEAVGGVPPLVWSATLDAMTSSFTMEPATGVLSGRHPEPATASLRLTVKDAAGASDSVTMPLVIRPAEPLKIVTESAPSGEPEIPYEAALTASGGVPPYTWLPTTSLPEGLTLSSEGVITGLVTEAGEFTAEISVKDAQNAAESRMFTFRFTAGLEITNPAALPPVAPGRSGAFQMEVEGGEPPYTWELTGGALPSGSWELTTGGELSGVSSTEELAEFSIRVTDALGGSFEKTFRLAIGDLLIAVPSQEKVGLAWSAGAVERMVGGRVAGYLVERDGRAVYEGTADNFVDHGVPTGSTAAYTLYAADGEGTLQPLSTRSVRMLPMTKGRAVPGESGDPHADRVMVFQPLSANGFGAASAPANVTGPPDGRGTYSPASRPAEVLSLHASRQSGGFIELEFVDNIVELGPGEDLTVFENVLFVGGDANNRFMEPAVVSVALFPGEWRRLPVDVTPPGDGMPVNTRNPFYYRAGIAGRNGTTGDDPTDPTKSGGDSFDLNPAASGLSWIRFVRIQSTGDAVMVDDNGDDPIRHDADPLFSPVSGSGSSGFDLDAVTAVRY